MRDGINTRKRLERCALVLFVQKGVTETTIKDIAKEAGIAEGTLYRHYKSKEALAQNLFTIAYDEMSQAVKKIIMQSPSLEDKVQGMISFFCQKYDEDPILFNYLLLVQHIQLKMVKGKESDAHELLVKMFNEAIRHKQIQGKSADICAAIVLGVVLQAAISRVYQRIQRTMTEDAQILAKAIFAALRS